MDHTEKTRNVHQGRNVKRLREMQGIKQEAFAYELGDTWTQKKVSQLESKETIEFDLLEQVAKILRVTPETIQKLDEDSAVNIISNTFTDFKDNASGINYNCDITFNPIEKVMELYERLLQSEKEKNDILKGKE
jgi:transcriptional regulator with XRE-family HTH domain